MANGTGPLRVKAKGATRRELLENAQAALGATDTHLYRLSVRLRHACELSPHLDGVLGPGMGELDALRAQIARARENLGELHRDGEEHAWWPVGKD
jgi:hypothetical protein